MRRAHGASAVSLPAEAEACEAIVSAIGRAVVAADPFAMLDLGDSRVAQVIQRLRRVAATEVPVLLHGETGTGKELFARATHQASHRSAGPFIAVNCAAIPEGLIESELFGYQAGAFTGAAARGSQGLIHRAHGGTLFLDEIGDMPLSLQSRLLRVLSQREVTPLGASQSIEVNFRLVSATHRDLPRLVATGQFRADLLFRLRGLSVVLPPVRAREDVQTLVHRLLSTQGSNDRSVLELDAEAKAFIAGYSWPGNVRELKQVLDTAVCLCENQILGASELRAALGEPGDGSDALAASAAEVLPMPRDERSALLFSLKRNRWNVSKTAHELKAARTTIYRRMSRLGIVQPHLLA